MVVLSACADLHGGDSGEYAPQEVSIAYLKSLCKGSHYRIVNDYVVCVMRGTALAEGIGEELSSLPPMPKCYILVAKPAISVSTKWVYETLDAKEIVEHPDIDGLLQGLKEQDLSKVASSMGNVLESVTIEKYPIIETIKDAMKEAGALNAMMSGSGPTVFGIFDNRKVAKEAWYKLRNMDCAKQVYLANVHNVRRK